MEMKGFVFTLDAIIAIIIVMSVVGGSYSLLVQSNKGVDLLNREASDILFVLDENGTIASLDNTTINNAISSLVPTNAKYNYNVTYYNTSGTNLIFDQTFLFTGASNESDIIFDVRTVPVSGNEGTSSIPNLTRIARVKLGVSL